MNLSQGLNLGPWKWHCFPPRNVSGNLGYIDNLWSSLSMLVAKEYLIRIGLENSTAALKMLGLYLDFLKIGHKFGSMFSIHLPNEWILQKKNSKISQGIMFLDKKNKITSTTKQNENIKLLNKAQPLGQTSKAVKKNHKYM